jgi:fructose-1,6-bisphosphatase/inositol monophosphatase family enzyme
VQQLADRARTVNVTGSCALGLGLVAAGRVDLLVQPPQWPWDWAAGTLLVEEAGGMVQFYEYDQSGSRFVNELVPAHFSPDRRALGLVAGDPGLVKIACELLNGGLVEAEV